MAKAKNRILKATKPLVSLTPDEQGDKNRRTHHEWNKRCALELKKHDGLSTGARFFGAAFSLLFAGKKRADLDQMIDKTIDEEASAETLSLLLHCGPSGRSGQARAKDYVADYFESKEKRNREKRFHDSVVFLFEEGFTRDELHTLAAQAEEN